MSQDNHYSVQSVKIPVIDKQVLIVEDEEVFARAVQKKLSRAGYKSEIAGNLAIAGEKYRSTSPDLVLLDMRLPDGSGLDFLSELKLTPNSGTAVIVMSAYGELEDAVAAMK
ncbi:MAG: response regulator, partial [Gammaproteobacteria bacterium]